LAFLFPKTESPRAGSIAGPSPASPHRGTRCVEDGFRFNSNCNWRDRILALRAQVAPMDEASVRPVQAGCTKKSD
jgi:hypothetical protein